MALREEGAHSGNRSALSQRFWSPDLHYQVFDMTWFKKMGLVGPMKSAKDIIRDKGFTGYPVVAVTDFQTKAGDRLTLPLFDQFAVSESAGVKYGTDTLVDSEQNYTFQNCDVYINLERTGAGWLGQMSEVRTGYNLREIGTDGLKVWQQRRHDDSMFTSIYEGYNKGVSSSSTGALAKGTITHPNIYPAGGGSSIAEVDSGDVLNAAYLEDLEVEANVKNIPMCQIKGYPDSWVLLIHSYQWRTLRADAAWKAEVGQGQFRGDKNPLFGNSVGRYAGILVLVVPGLDKIQTATAAEAGDNAVNIRKALLLGATSCFYAVKQEASEIIPRNEYDYKNKNGLAIQSIYGCAAAHWLSDDGNSTRTNQSSYICPTWAPNPRYARV